MNIEKPNFLKATLTKEESEIILNASQIIQELITAMTESNFTGIVCKKYADDEEYIVGIKYLSFSKEILNNLSFLQKIYK